MIKYYATIYNTKTNAQTKFEADTKETLYEKMGDVVNGKPLDNIEAEIYGADTDDCRETERFFWKPKMIDLKKYSKVIREAVKEENDRDKNWRWSVKSIGKNLVRIRWEYLSEVNGKNDSFLIRLYPETVNNFEYPVSQVLSARHPDESEIVFDFVTEGEPDPNDILNVDTNIETALKRMIHRIAVLAHNCY